jgi:hypothetical protein
MSFSRVPENGSVVLAEYKSRILSLQTRIASLRPLKIRALIATFTCVALSGVSLFAALNGSALFFAALVPALAGSVAALRNCIRILANRTEFARRSSFYEKGIDRIEGNWRGEGTTGADYGRADHFYQNDLDILGEGSLFELLSTTRSEVGAERLAAFLLDPTTFEEARSRQEAVKELRGATGLREDVALLGKYQFQTCEGQHLRDWLNLPAIPVLGIVPGFLLVSCTATLVLGLCGFAKIFSWAQIQPVLAPLLVVQAAIGVALLRNVRLHLKTLLRIGSDVAILEQGVSLLERQQFGSAKLCSLLERLRAGNAAACMRKLRRLLTLVERREDVFLYALCLWLALGTQLVLATERWRAAHREQFEEWLNAWAEFEALNALAGYAYEHPEDEFPELLDGDARFEAAEMRHPLLKRARCVGNDVSLNRTTAFYIVSGSNMAGKSTYLRAIGLNAVLAAAGAPVCATHACIGVFNICASISIADSLAEGKSKFLAEVERLRAAIGATEGGLPVLFLVDEILSGTNSRDRRVAAESVIAAFVAGGAVGMLSTHDLALTEIAANASLHGVNVHMQSESADHPLAFDYRVKPGILSRTNALAIVKMLGIGA